MVTVGENGRLAGKGCGIVGAVIVGVPLLVVAVVGVKTCAPLQEAGEAMVELERALGSDALYRPSPSGAIPAARMVLFLDVRSKLVEACGDYGQVQRGFDAVDSLETRDSGDAGEVGDVAMGLGGAALAITPFLARYFKLRNVALLEASMGLEEYSYIYATAYHDLLLSERTRREIFSDGEALSPEASAMLAVCLARQRESVQPTDQMDRHHAVLAAEQHRMEAESNRLIWQDGLPEAVRASIDPYRKQLDGLFCRATAGLDMERSSRRALRVALE